MSPRAFASVATLLLLLSPFGPESRSAQAVEPAAAVEAARSHFLAGQQAYRDGKFVLALQEFQAGYALSPRPEFVLNFAQTYRRLGRLDEAVSECERFIAVAPDSPLANEAQSLLRTLRREKAVVDKAAAEKAAAEKTAAEKA